MVAGPVLVCTVDGHMLVIVGVELLTIKLQEIFCVLFAAGTPDAVMVTLPVYGFDCGVSAVGSTTMLSVRSSPGSTMPVDGVTVSQLVPATAAVNETGSPLVDSVTVWAGTGVGGATKLSVVVLSVKVGSGALTFSVTGMASGVTTPDTVTFTTAEYMPTPRLVGFTRMVSVPGVFPESGLTVTHNADDGAIAVVNGGVPVLARTETLWTPGICPPI